MRICPLLSIAAAASGNPHVKSYPTPGCLGDKCQLWVTVERRVDYSTENDREVWHGCGLVNHHPWDR